MLIFTNEQNKSTLSRQEKAGKVIKLFTGIYSNDTQTSKEIQVKQNLTKILSFIRPSATISHKSALQHDFGLSTGYIYITDHNLVRDYQQYLHGVTIVSMVGHPPLNSDTLIDGIYVSSKGRAILESLENVRAGGLSANRTPSIESLKKLMGVFLSSSGAPNGLKLLLESVNDESGGNWSKELQLALGLITELSPLNLNVSNLDKNRIALFEDLASALSRGIYGNEDINDSGSLFNSGVVKQSDNLSFYASYFSNFIEGTEFDPEEAKSIVDSSNPHTLRPRDGHDIKSLYELYTNKNELMKNDDTADDFIHHLKHWHKVFADHPQKQDILAGQFKDKSNRAGNTWFTEPHLVEATLRKSWDIGRSLKTPFDLAIYRALTTVSVHPFIDGNGRITRFAAANVLSRANKPFFIIPNVYREDYILAMKAFSDGDPIPAIRMFKRATEMTIEVPWEESWTQVTNFLKNKNAFCAPNDAQWGGELPVEVKSIGFNI